MALKNLEDFSVNKKLVLLRIDINSPIANSKVLDNPRFKESAETIRYLIKRKAKLAIIAHQGRKGDSDFSELKQHAVLLSKHSKIKINYIDDIFGSKALNAIKNLKPGEAVLLANVRSCTDEFNIKNKENRYKSLCKNFDFYVNDAFSVSHREQGSIVLPPKFLPSCIGISFQKELSSLQKLRLNKKKVVYLLGGSKVEDSLPLFSVLNNKNNLVLASGVLANLFLVSLGKDLGYTNLWLRKRRYYPLIPKFRKIYLKHKKQIILPVDFAIDKAGRKEMQLEKFPLNEMIWDVGHETVKNFIRKISGSASIFMKGPLGFSEIPKFSYGTVQVLKYISKLSGKKKVFSLLGGGHLSTTIQKYHIRDNFSYKSTSGGALIAFISGKELPGIKALEN